MRTLTAASLFAVVLALGCSKPPKQADVPEIERSGSGEDMAAEDTAPHPVGSAEAAAGPAVDEMKSKCFAECKAGLAKDRTGAAAETIPCTDFTADLSPWCLEYFRAHPTMANAVK